jgi:hypothetical protein
MAEPLEITREPKAAGDQFTLSIKPPVLVGCHFEVFINATRVQPGDTFEGLRVAGFGANGQVTLEPGVAHPNARVTIVVICPGGPGPGQRPARVAQRDIGAGWIVQPRERDNPDRGRKRQPRFDKDFAGEDSQREDH